MVAMKRLTGMSRPERHRYRSKNVSVAAFVY
jgi:hypothetical protein